MSDTSPRLVVITDDPGLRATVVGLNGRLPYEVQFLGGFGGGGKESGTEPRRVRDQSPELVILDLGADPVVGVQFAQALADLVPGLPILATGPELTTELLIAGMRAGITEYLPAPVWAEDLTDAIRRAGRRRAATAAPAEKAPGQLIAFLPVKGGAGVTTLAVNLAVQIHRATQESTLLVDLDLEFGDTALLLGLQPRFSFLDLVRNIHRLDPALLNSYTDRHPSGIHVLTAPTRPERSDGVTAEEAKQVVKLFREAYHFVVVDPSKSLSPLTWTVLRQATQIIAVTTPDLPTLGSIKRALPILEKLGGDVDRRTRVVLNRCHPDDTLTEDDVRELLDKKVDWTLRNDFRSVIRAANEGTPIVLNGRSPYAEDVVAMVTGLVGERAAARRAEDAPTGPIKRILGLLQRR